MRKLLRLLAGDNKGATAIEYGLILSLIVVVLITGLKFLAGSTITMWNNVAVIVGGAG
jgi:pilus assembly protein Flp/PilA